MNRPLGVLRGAATATRERISTVTSQSERTLLLGAILLGSALSAVTAYVLVQCYAVDVVSTLLLVPQDCWLDWGMKIGRHCFSDYAMSATAGTKRNPAEYLIWLPPDYQPIAVGSWAPARLPYSLFGSPAHWLGAPRLGLVCFLFALSFSVISPAVWAARGARGLEKVVIFLALGAAAVPAWGVIDRGNSTGFLAPIALAFLIGLTRQRWGLVVIMVVLATVLKPQFVVLGAVLLAARQWRWSAVGIVGVVISNAGAFLLWPQGFPGTILQSLNGLAKFNSSVGGLQDTRNVSFGRALLLIPDSIKTAQAGQLPRDFLAGPRTLIGFAILVIVVAAVVTLGRRIPPIMVGIVLLAAATLAPSYTAFYYLVFALPVAAVIVRDPIGPSGAGIFDRLSEETGPRRTVAICTTIAVLLSIVNIALPGQPFSVPIYGQLGARGVIGHTSLVATTVAYTGLFWLIASTAIIVSYARRPVDVSNENQFVTALTAASAPHDAQPLAGAAVPESKLRSKRDAQ